MSFRSRAALLCVLGALLGCHRSPGPPDPNYEQALRTYQQLYARKLDDAYADPQMDDIIALLRKVDSRSIDASPARGLLAAIEDGRKRLEAERAEREKARSILLAPLPNIDPSAVSASAKPVAPPVDPYGPGASLVDMNSASGGCLVAAEPFQERGTGTKGTIYRMAPSPACADKLAGFVGQAALVVDGKLYRRMPESEIPKPPAPPPPATRAQPKQPQASAQSN